MIFHVSKKADWDQAKQQGYFEVPSLQLEGFIHMSQQHQISGVLDRYYKEATDLLLLHVDESRLTSSVKYELSPSLNESFPHVFGPINLDAVVHVEPI